MERSLYGKHHRPIPPASGCNAATDWDTLSMASLNIQQAHHGFKRSLLAPKTARETLLSRHVRHTARETKHIPI